MDDSTSEADSLGLKIKHARVKRNMYRITAWCFSIIAIVMTIDVVLGQEDKVVQTFMWLALSMTYWTIAYIESSDLAKATKDLERLKQ